MFNLAICDDDSSVVEQLEGFIEKIPDISLEYEVFFNAEELYNYKKSHQLDFDVYMLDIEIENSSGLDLAKKLRMESPYS